MAGNELVARHFPLLIGRASGSDLLLEDDGVWASHCRIDCVEGKGFILYGLENAIVSVNGQALEEVVLKNGDTLDIGGAKVRFWIGNTEPKNFRWRERLTWAGFIGVLVLQVYLIYWLAR